MLEAGIETTGTLHPDGAVTLDEPPRLAPGRVRVALAPLPAVRLPDGPFLDESIPAPFDLPWEGLVRAVVAERVPYRYPDLSDFGPEGAS
ncbi:MAG: hypothetical protein K2X87_27640 [Gemmataceae bacterium]|nr:hypothetical protein [Gemmataceae bacterium]